MDNLIAQAPPTLQAFETVFGNALTSLLYIAGILVFFTFIVGGFKYLTSGGDPKAVAAAHSTLSYAFLGLVLTILSFMFILVIQFITGNSDLLNFRIYR